MDENKRESSPSTEGCGTPPKRRKTDDPGDPSLLNSSASKAQTENMSLPKKSSPITATKTRLNQIRTEINSLFYEERRILEDEAKSDKLANENLELRLAETAKCCQEAKAAQVVAEAKISQLRTEMDQKITKLLNQNSELEKRMIDQATQDTAKLNAAATRIIKLEQEIKSAAVSQEEFKLKAMQFQESNMEISKLESDRECLWEEIKDLLPKLAVSKDLEEELKSIKDGIPTPCESLEEGEILDEVTGSDDKKSNNAGRIKEQLVPGECELSSDFVKNQLENSKEEISHSQESKLDQSQMKEQKSQQSEALKAGSEGLTNGIAKHDSNSSSNDSSIPVIEKDQKSDNDNPQDQPICVNESEALGSEFFEIDWTKWYQQKGLVKYNCNKCGKVKKSKTDIEDHVWGKHHGGYFICPFCHDPPVSSSRRNHIKRHMKEVH